MTKTRERRWLSIWYEGAPAPFWAGPAARLYGWVSAARRALYRFGWLPRCRASVPVIVVGNISVGGTGKTPLVIWLVEYLRAAGHTPAVISRGYGSAAGKGPVRVTDDTHVAAAGDEPVLIARRTQALVFVGANRCACAAAATAAGASIIISDDGLQHYRLERDVEIVVEDADRGRGNGRLLPAGPLREPLARVGETDLCLAQTATPRDGLTFTLVGDTLHAVGHAATRAVADLAGERVVAMAGVGNPERFFQALDQAGLELTRHALDDHAPAADYPLADNPDALVIVTEKDAVKLQQHDHRSLWYLPVVAEPSASARAALASVLAPFVQR